MCNKLFKIGDSPIVGCGTYADNLRYFQLIKILFINLFLIQTEVDYQQRELVKLL
jgi:hypothetical protein